jgi:hypothetical protein
MIPMTIGKGELRIDQRTPPEFRLRTPQLVWTGDIGGAGPKTV